VNAAGYDNAGLWCAAIFLSKPPSKINATRELRYRTNDKRRGFSMANVKQAVRPPELRQSQPIAPPQLKAVPQAAAPAAPPPPAPVPGNMMQELKVTGHMMSLPAGLFCIVNETSAVTGRSGGMPGVRISPPPIGADDVEIAGFRPDGWLSAEGDATLVRIRKGPAQVLVTIYQLPDQPDSAPKLQVRQLLGNGPEQPVTPAAQTRMDILAHIQTRGDVGAIFGSWLGERGSQNWIEGFAIAAPEGIDPADLSYQAVLGRGWLSPWVEAGAYCGSRGMALPLLGLRVRLTGAAAEQYDITCAATFVGGTSAGPVDNDETCEGDELAPLEAMLITLTPKARKPLKAKR
jgi:hypothetical protein